MASLLKRQGALMLCLLLSLQFVKAQVSTTDVDWNAFLAQHDLVWDTIPADYYSGAILGNGMLGTNIYATDENGYRWDIGRSDVNEKREGESALYHRARLIIGNFTLYPTGEVTAEDMRLSIYDAVASGKLTTTKGSIDFNTYVDANHDIICIETTATPGERDFGWEWRSDKAVSPRTLFPYTMAGAPKDYLNSPNPDVELITSDNINMAVQRLYSGYVYVTAWTKSSEGDKRRILVTVSFEPSEKEAITKAKRLLTDYQKKNSYKLLDEHKEWWHQYYPASFVSFPDVRIESFYWLQQYKLVCVTRPDKLIIDLMGPWPYKTPWPAIWWNLNIQLTYSPMTTANRAAFSTPLWKSLIDKQAALIENVTVPEWRADAAIIGRSSSYDLVRPLSPSLAKQNQYEVGNLTWVMFYYLEYCTHQPDKKELIKRFFPLLKRCIGYYEHIMFRGEDGKYHLPLTASPEYKPAEDCNYDLALLRWGTETLLHINKEYKLNDTKESIWQDILNNLTPYPIDPEQGYMIGKDVRLESSHRHYSHLLMVYPLGLINPDEPANRELILRSLNHWMGMKGALQGYTYTGGSSMYSLLGNGNKAVEFIEQLLERYIQPNTLYKETGPVIETPFSAVASLHELYIQERNNTIKVFPAVADKWKDASFIDLRCEGGFLISGIRKNGMTQMIQVKSTVPGTCRIETAMKPGSFNVKYTNNNRKPDYSVVDAVKGTIELKLKKGETIQITTNGYNENSPFYTVRQKDINPFGKRKTKY